MNGVNGIPGPHGPAGQKVRFSPPFSVFIHTKTTLILMQFFLAYRGIRVLQVLRGRGELMDPLA